MFLEEKEKDQSKCNSKTTNRSRPKLTILQQISYMRDVKGIGFSTVTEDEARLFLEKSNYYFKIKAFSKNYPQCKNGDRTTYYGLEFAYLQELSTLDMYLRECIRSFTVDIEHYLKLRLLNDIADDAEEDGYRIVEEYLALYPDVKDSINEQSRKSYCEKLIQSFEKRYAVWNIVEVLSFGELINLCELYYTGRSHPSKGPRINIGKYRIVKFLRNAAAHNNCIINDLRLPQEVSFNQSRTVNSFISKIDGISAKTQTRKMSNRAVHDFVVMLFCFNEIVSSEGIKKHRMQSLQQLINERFLLHRDYFQENALLCSNYNFIKKVVDKFANL